MAVVRNAIEAAGITALPTYKHAVALYRHYPADTWPSVWSSVLSKCNNDPSQTGRIDMILKESMPKKNADDDDWSPGEETSSDEDKPTYTRQEVVQVANILGAYNHDERESLIRSVRRRLTNQRYNAKRKKQRL